MLNDTDFRITDAIKMLDANIAVVSQKSIGRTFVAST
jgi:hypothetical protein